jgi:hypothetical protein
MLPSILHYLKMLFSCFYILILVHNNFLLGICVCVCVCVCVCDGTEVWTESLAFSNQVLYHLSHAISPFIMYFVLKIDFRFFSQ